MDYKNIITEFYKKHNPDQLDKVDYLLEKYKGKEDQLLKSLEDKYAKMDDSDLEDEQVSEESAVKEEPTKKPVETKTEYSAGEKEDWEKRREQIMKDIKERAASLKKKREQPEEKQPEPEIPDEEKEKPITPKEQPPQTTQEPISEENSKVDISSTVKKEEPEKVKEKEKEKKPPVSKPNDNKRKEQTKKEPAYVVATADILKPILQITNPDNMSASQRAAFWGEQLERRKQQRFEQSQNRKAEESQQVVEPESSEKPEPKSEAKALASGSESQKSDDKKRGYKKYLIIGIILVAIGATVFAAINFGIFDSNYSEGTESKREKKSAILPGAAHMDDQTEASEEPMNESPVNESEEAEDDATSNEESDFALTEDDTEEQDFDEPAFDEEPESAKQGKETTNLITPTFVVSYATFSSETYASAGAAELRNIGFDGGYYFIPDYMPSGKPMYKVYAGPYSTIEEAELKAEEVRAYSPGAYVIDLQ